MSIFKNVTKDTIEGYIIIAIHYIIFISLSGLILYSWDFFTLFMVLFNLIIIYACNVLSESCPLTLMEKKRLGKDTVSMSSKYIFKSKYSSDKKSILQLQLILMGINITISKLLVILLNRPIIKILTYLK